MEILSEDEKRSVRGMANYWREVNGRDNRAQVSDILASELHQVVSMLGFKVLWILSEYVEDKKQ